MSDEPRHLEVDHTEPDEWHTHTPDEGPPQEEHTSRVNAGILFLVFCVMTVSLTVTVVALIFYFSQHTTALKTELHETTDWRTDISIPYRESARQALTGYAWEDEDNEVVRVPLDLAIDRVIERYSEGQE
ncbi:MAG: hypothetical protein JJU33_14315 [Phycisphaerales bacterium]|nr:hypothetical protein [Phycisphaerales bacterium]